MAKDHRRGKPHRIKQRVRKTPRVPCFEGETWFSIQSMMAMVFLSREAERHSQTTYFRPVGMFSDIPLNLGYVPGSVELPPDEEPTEAEWDRTRDAVRHALSHLNDWRT